MNLRGNGNVCAVHMKSSQHIIASIRSHLLISISLQRQSTVNDRQKTKTPLVCGNE